MVNLEWFRTFKAIYNTGTLTQASKVLLISQPNVSQHLSFLEAHIGKKLFERKPRRMVPTDYGKLFYSQLIGPLEGLERLESEFRYTRESDIPLTCIGVSRDFYTNKISSKVGLAPANLVFEFDDFSILNDNLLHGNLNFLISEYSGQEKNIQYEEIFISEDIVVANSALDTHELDILSVDQQDEIEQWLLNQKWYTYSSDLILVKSFWQENFKKRPNIKPCLIIPDFNALIGTLIQGHGLSIVPSYIAESYIQDNKLKEICPNLKKHPIKLYLAYNKNVVSSHQIDMIKDLLL